MCETIFENPVAGGAERRTDAEHLLRRRVRSGHEAVARTMKYRARRGETDRACVERFAGETGHLGDLRGGHLDVAGTFPEDVGA